MNQATQTSAFQASQAAAQAQALAAQKANTTLNRWVVG